MKTLNELNSELDAILLSAQNRGELMLIVSRPALNERTVMESAVLDCTKGLYGDYWYDSHISSGKVLNRDKQLTIMNFRCISLIAEKVDRIPLAGDQIYLDMDLSYENLPPGTRLQIGTATIEISAAPHRGCKKFAARYGLDAMRFVNSDLGRKYNLRGVNAFVVQAGIIKKGDEAVKIAAG